MSERKKTSLCRLHFENVIILVWASLSLLAVSVWLVYAIFVHIKCNDLLLGYMAKMLIFSLKRDNSCLFCVCTVTVAISHTNWPIHHHNLQSYLIHAERSLKRFYLFMLSLNWNNRNKTKQKYNHKKFQFFKNISFQLFLLDMKISPVYIC